MIPQILVIPLAWIGVCAIVMLGFAGTLALVKGAVAKVETTVKSAMAANHVMQAIAEFKTNHPEIAALYADIAKKL